MHSIFAGLKQSGGNSSVLAANVYGDGKRFTAAGALAFGTAWSLSDTTNNPFTSADVNKLVVIDRGGAGSFGTNRGDSSFFITAVSTSGNAVLSFNTVVNAWAVNIALPTAGSRIFFQIGAGTGGMATLVATVAATASGYAYLGTVSGAGPVYTATLYQDAALTTPFAAPGTTGTCGAQIGTVQLLAKISAFVSASQVTLTKIDGSAIPAVGFAQAVSAATYVYGTDNTAAINTAIAAGGQVTLPAGIILVNGVDAKPNTILTGFTYEAVSIQRSGVTLAGQGQGITQVLRCSWQGRAVSVNSTTAAITGVVVRDMTVGFAIPVSTRQDTQYANAALGIAGTASNTCRQCTAYNLEIKDATLGIMIADNCDHCSGHDCYIHDILANGAACDNSSIGGMDFCGYSNCYVRTTGDSAYAFDNAPTATSGGNIFLTNCSCSVIGNFGVEVSGVGNVIVSGLQSDLTLNGCVVVEAYYSGSGGTSNVIISGCQALGTGLQPMLFGNYGGSLPCADFVVFNNTADVTISGISFVGNSGGLSMGNATLPVGPTFATYAPSGGTIRDVMVEGHMSTSARQLLVSGGSVGPNLQGAYGSGAAVDIINGDGIILRDLMLAGSARDGVRIGASVIGSVIVDGVRLRAPNSNAAANVYAVNVLGGSAPQVDHIDVRGAATLAGKLNYQPDSVVTNLWTFTTAGGFSNASIAGQAGTGVGATAWTVPAGTVTVNTVTNVMGATVLATGVATAMVDIKRWDVDASFTIGTAPTAASQLFVGVGSNGTVSLVLDVYTGQPSFGSQSTPASQVAPGAPSAGDIIRLIKAGARLYVLRNRSGTITVLGSYPCPEYGAGQGGQLIVSWLSLVPTLSAVTVR